MFEMFVNREIQHICLPKALCAKRVSCYRGDRLSYQRGLRKCDESQSIARGRVKRLFAQLMWLDPVSSLSDSRTWLRHAKFWFDLDFLCMVNSRRSSMPFAFHIFHSPKRATWFCAHARHTDINAWFDESSKCEWTSQVESNIFFDPCIILFFWSSTHTPMRFRTVDLLRKVRVDLMCAERYEHSKLCLRLAWKHPWIFKSFGEGMLQCYPSSLVLSCRLFSKLHQNLKTKWVTNSKFCNKAARLRI